MAQPNWAPTRKAGESRADYQKRYYSAQREYAQKEDPEMYGKIMAKKTKAERGGSSLQAEDVRGLAEKGGQKFMKENFGG